MASRIAQALFLLWIADQTAAFSNVASSLRQDSTKLQVSIGLGPDEDQVQEKKELIAGVDYEVPDHEAFRLSRRSKLDETCDQWFGALMGDGNGVLGSVAETAREILTTPVPLINEVGKRLTVHIMHARLKDLNLESCFFSLSG